ncbi:MAG TPA: peptide deformylase [Vicinamibacterales bacterium]|nr:peptide deformylase [Vicinamibacterales bacterium]
MSSLKVARMGNPVLRKKARALDRKDLKSANVQKLIDDMLHTMIEYHGAGLAAPQVHLDLRLFVAIDDPENDAEPVVFVNPEITKRSDEIVEDWEGCLSIPDVRGKVPRAREITVRALDRNGERMEFDAREFAARVIQHEYDHIEGILFLDRMRSLDSLAFVSVVSTVAPAF